MSTDDSNAPPALCSSCLGPSKHVRLIRDKNSLECKLCTRPFTVYKWNSQTDKNSRKHTTICLTCARQRNCCQSCLLDLTYGISIQLRDAALKMAGIDNLNYAEPKNVVSKLYIAGNEAKFEKLGGAQHTSDAEKARDILTKLAHSIKNKDMGINIEKKGKDKNTLPSHISSIDITKILSKLPLNGSLKLPTDETIKSLFVFGIDDSLPEYKLTEYFETFGSIKSFNCQHNAKAGYITFNERKGAENAAQEILKLNSNDETKPALFIIDNIPLRCCWGKERPLGNSYAEKVKLGSVVTKVMKKLAKESSPKEIKSPTKKRTLATQDHTVVKKPQLDDKKTYKSLSKNYEA